MISSHPFRRWFRGAAASPSLPEDRQISTPRTTRRCVGVGEFTRDLAGQGDKKPSVLDMGPTSPANIAFLAERNFRVYNEDILRAVRDPSLAIVEEDGSQRLDVEKFFTENMAYPDQHFEAILCWDVMDYLPEELVKPLVDKIHSILRPKGRLLAFFHLRDIGSDSPYRRYHIVQPDVLELEPEPGLRIQRIFNNRHVENLFRDCTSRTFFLGRDNIREVLVIR